MIFSEQWIREWVNPDISTEALVEKLTMAGLEVDGIEPVAGKFSQVFVGEIIEIHAHPDAEKLRVCTVDTGQSEPLQIVCGASNARKGLKTPCAIVGAVLPGDFKIKKAKLRGIASFGMLCGADELGLSEERTGIMELPSDAPVGADLRHYLVLNDQKIEVDLTPNRSDCLSIAGIARELHALTTAPLSPVEIKPVVATIDQQPSISIEDSAGCPKYLGRIIRNVDLSRASPLWMQEKLRRSGLRSIDPVVDVTNYVMLELGQPLHAFDLDQIDQKIVVRRAKNKEHLVLLNGNQVNLTEDTLLICDQSKPLAIAGVMGGEHSGVSENTQHILLESAFFAPECIAGKARAYGMHTDASHRFERGVDPELAELAIERATSLLLAIVGGEAGPVASKVEQSQLPQQPEVLLRRVRLKKVLGFSIADEQIVQIIEGLGMKQTNHAEGWLVSPPSYRLDIGIEEDLIEELARVYGYNQVPTTLPVARLSFSSVSENQLPIAKVKSCLLSLGYQEVVSYSFVENQLNLLLAEASKESIGLRNPIAADMSHMRLSLWPGLLKTLEHNLNRQQDRARLFEVGLVFSNQEGQYHQEKCLGGLIYGAQVAQQWRVKQEKLNFFDAKADVEALITLTRKKAAYEFRPESHPALHPGQSAAVYCGERRIGWLGAIHPTVQQQLGLKQTAYLFELVVDALLEAERPQFQPISKFPETRRDVAFIVNDQVTSKQVLKLAHQRAGDLLSDAFIFDIYAGGSIEAGKKSIAMGLTFQHPSRTLKDEEVDEAVESVFQGLREELSAILRD